MSLIAIDLGTSFIKGAVLNLDTLEIEHVRRMPVPAPLPGLPPLYKEYDPLEMVAAVRWLLTELSPFAEDAEGVVMCTQMHGVVLTTERGEAKSTLTTWQDQRVLMPHPSGNGTYFDVMKGRLSQEEIRQMGNELRPGLPIGLFFWWAEQGMLPDENLIPADLAHFVLANLCESTPVTELTNGMAHGLVNLETLTWHEGVIAKLGLQSLRLPEIKGQGEVAAWLPFGECKIPCYAAIGDYQCALLGSLIGEGELSLNISTGSQVSLLKPSVAFGNFQTRPFFDGQYAIAITHIPAGRALNALVKLLTELGAAHNLTVENPWPYITEQAGTVGETQLKVNLSFFNSSVGERGAITDMLEDELTVGHLFRAAFQNMADNYYTFAQYLSPEKAWKNLVFSGGLVQKIDVLRQMICDQFGLPYRLSPSAEDTLLGLMVLGLVCTGRAKSVSEATEQLSARYDRAVSSK